MDEKSGLRLKNTFMNKRLVLLLLYSVPF